MKPQPFLFIRVNRKYERLDLVNLIYAESRRGYIRLVTDTDNYMLYSTLLALEGNLPREQFSRIHRSYIVALQRVSSFDKNEVSLRVRENIKKLPIGKERYGELVERVVMIGESPTKNYSVVERILN